jgi:hypothetical protein
MKDAHGHGSNSRGSSGGGVSISSAPSGMEHQFSLAALHGIDVSHISGDASAEGANLYEMLSHRAQRQNPTLDSGLSKEDEAGLENS